ncbi:retrovirus-related pol polyprotein from transposon TNT 1-94 [Tanacetum coccineum]
MISEDDALSKEKEIDKLVALISLSFNKIYKPTNNNLRNSSNTSRANQDNTLRIYRGTGYDNQRVVNVVRARENVGTQVVQQSGIQCYNCKEYRHVARECQKPKRAKDAAYHKEKMLLYQELEAHYMYTAQIQEVTPNAVDNSWPIFDAEPFYDREQDDHDDNDDLAKERNLLASLIEKLKCETDDNKNRNKFLETSNKALVDKLKGEIKSFKTKNKSLESLNNHFKEANNELSKTNQLMFKDLKKFQAKFDRYHDVNYASKVAIDCAKAKGDLIFVKPEFLKKAQRENPRLYDIVCYNDNLALMLAPESDKTIRLAQESQSKLSDLIRPFDYKNLNNLYDLFVPQREKSPGQRYFSESKLSQISTGNSKNTILNEIGRFSKKYFYADHMNAILGMHTTLDEFTNLQCDYVDQVVKCELLEKELSKSNITSKGFEALQQHAINLELVLQQCQEQIKNGKDFKENQSKVFLKEPEQYFETQDLKAQLQDKGIAINELKKLIEKMKGKYVETKFEKPLVIRQLNAFKCQRQSVLCKPATFSNSLAKTDFSKSKLVTINNVSNDFSKPVAA